MKLREELNIVDAQIHIGAGETEKILAKLDALGIKGVLLDECWMEGTHDKPYEVLSNGARRPIMPTAQAAATSYPDRFAYLRRINRADPDAVFLVRQMAESAGGKAIRLDVGMNPPEVGLLKEGGYDHILSAIDEYDLPVFVYAPDSPDMYEAVAKRFPSLKIVVDHCGVFSAFMRECDWTAVSPLSDEEHRAMFERVLALSEYPNIGLKWAHASEVFACAAFPGEGLRPYLRKAIDAFGSERIMWASDYNAMMTGESWGELLHGLRGNADLTDKEMADILGNTARAWLKWPAE